MTSNFNEGVKQSAGPHFTWPHSFYHIAILFLCIWQADNPWHKRLNSAKTACNAFYFSFVFPDIDSYPYSFTRDKPIFIDGGFLWNHHNNSHHSHLSGYQHSGRLAISGNWSKDQMSKNVDAR
jgi:hypothetical protein